MAVTLMDCCKVFWAIFLPPLAVALHRGCCTCSFLINICLTILGWIPGVIHAFCVISDCDVKSDGTYDEERAAAANAREDAANARENAANARENAAAASAATAASATPPQPTVVVVEKN